MTVEAVPEVATMDSAGVSRSSSQLSGSSESLNSNNNSSDDGNNNNNMVVNGTVLKEISGNGNNLVFKVSAGPLAMGPKVMMGAKKKMSAPPQMIEEQSKLARQQHNNSSNNLPKLKIASIKEEGANDDECPPSATISEADSDVEYMGNRTEILPWNIVEDAPLTNRNELYPVEGSWRLISQQVSPKSEDDLGSKWSMNGIIGFSRAFRDYLGYVTIFHHTFEQLC